MAGPSGLTGLASLQTLVDTSPEATPEERLGGAADPRHSKRGEQSQPYAWQSQMVPGAAIAHPMPVPGIIDDYLFTESNLMPALVEDAAPYWDTAPYTHAAPWPADPIGDGSVQPENTARQLRQNYELRSKAGRNGFADPSVINGVPQQDIWQEIWEVNPNSDDLEPVNGQMRSGAAPGGRGGTDRTQSNARQNAYGFDSRHMHRRYAANSIPGNYMYLRPTARPMRKSLAGPARPPIGAGSQFEGQDLSSAFNTDGAILTQPAGQYQAPPTPYVGTAVYDDSAPPSWNDLYGVYE